MNINDEEEKKLEELCTQAFDFARNNDTESLETLLKAGLNVNLANHKGNTLLMLASYNGSLEVAKLLLEKGAEVDKVNDKGQTPLAGVCFKGYYEIAELLLKFGADPNYSVNSLTPMNCALMFRRKDIVKLLLKYSKQKLTFIQKMLMWFNKK